MPDQSCRHLNAQVRVGPGPRVRVRSVFVGCLSICAGTRVSFSAGRYFNMDQAILNALEMFDGMVAEGKIGKDMPSSA